MHKFLVLLSAVFVSSCTWYFGSWEQDETGLSLEQAVASSDRTPAFAARDGARHPLETLQFFGLRADQTVVEIWPGGGWWAEILAPYLKDRGQYYAAHFVSSHPNSPAWRREMAEKFVARFAGQPQRYGQVEVTELGRPDYWTPAPAGSADLVLTFRNVHNWMKGDYAPRMFQAFHDTLKAGGILGVVEHRAPPGTSLEAMKKSGYVTEAHVIALAEAAGFKLMEKSEINANPADTADHPAGVWTLPPSLRLGDQDRAKYLAIGESDRMTLKFVKPILVAPAG